MRMDLKNLFRGYILAFNENVTNLLIDGVEKNIAKTAQHPHAGSKIRYRYLQVVSELWKILEADFKKIF